MTTETIIVRDRPNAPTTRLCEWYLEGCITSRAELSQTRIVKSPFVIGRGSSADFRIPSANVSKLHAEILIGGEAVVIRDVNSSNGTYVNGRRIEAPTPVGDQDLLQFADMEFRLRRGESEVPAHTMVSERPQSGWLISRLYQVVNHQRFAMAFQPIVDSRTLKSVALEALVRCDLSGLESPMQLFKAAEQLGLEERVSEMCRTAAVRTLMNYGGNEDLFVNTHPNERLGEELIESLKSLRDQAGGRRIVLEIHEAAVPGVDTMQSFKAALKDLGILLAYDDFGAGQSRLVELTRVPPDFLKFDRSLLKGIREASVSQQQIVQTLVDIAHENDVKTVAEGLDDEETVTMCREMGFTMLQGFYFARPMPVEDLP